MKRIILCEGKTDAILVGYFLMRTAGWFFSRDSILKLPFNRGNESLCWFRHDAKQNQELAVWGAGGLDQVRTKFRLVVERNRNERESINRFERIVLLIDRDQRSVDECIGMLREWTEEAELALEGDLGLSVWVPALINLNKTPAETYRLELLPLVLPPDGNGALETFLANALRTNNAEDENLVGSSRQFIDALPDEPYLVQRRFRPKACLGAILSVMSPDWVFSEVDERLTAVRWEELVAIQNAYSELARL